MNVVIEEPFIFKNLPKLDELLCVVVSINSAEMKDSSVKTEYQWLLLKTRILTYDDENLIACPMHNNTKYLYIICKKEYYSSGCFSLLATKHLLRVESISRPSLETFKECLVYNIICKVSPDWNKVEKYFIMDKYFLLKRGVLNSIQLNLYLSGTDLYVYCKPKRLWLTPLDVLEFDIPVACLQHMVSRKFYIDLSSNPFWVHVLPSFNRGRVVYVTNRLPENCIFKDYTQMRRHWKNTYGFRLPVEDSQMIYVGVNFFGSQNFTYPLVCVRKGLHENDGHPLSKENFLKCLVDRVANNLFGNKLDLQDPATSNNALTYEAIPFEKWSEKNILKIDRRLIDNFVQPPFNHSAHTSMSESSNEVPEHEVYINVNKKPITTADSEWFEKCSTFINGLSQTNPKRSYAPLNPIKPILFRRKFCESVIRKPIFIDHPQLSQSPNGSPCQTVPTVSNPLPKSETKVLYKPIFIKKESLLKSKRSPHPKIERNCENENVNPIKKEVKPLINPVFNRRKFIPVKPHEPKSDVSLLDQNMNSVSLGTSNKDIVSFVPVTTFIDQEKANEYSEKKKPRLSTDAEISELFKSGTLNKVNAPSLYKFLKRHNVACTSKDKKIDLVVKAETFLKSNAL